MTEKTATTNRSKTRGWTKATLLQRLCEAMADEWGGDVNAYLESAEDVINGDGLDTITVAELVTVLKTGIVKEAMAKRVR